MEQISRERLQTTSRRLHQSVIEASKLKERDFRCPKCGFKIQTFFSDIRGHLKMKCPKCKEIFIINTAYFRSKKGSKRNY